MSESDERAVLDKYEMGWRDLYDFLESRGYQLRARYRPGWTPSWLTSGVPWDRSDDGVASQVRYGLTLSLELKEPNASSGRPFS